MKESLLAMNEGELVTRIQSDYREMPGLSLTLPRAARLWQIELSRCAAALECLAQSGVLRQVGERYLWSRGGV
jgi:hypothetical protein